MPTEIADPLELHVAALVNAARAEAGLAPVHVEVHLNHAAQSHSNWMSSEAQLSHQGKGGSTPGDRVEDSEFPLQGNWHLSENVGYKSLNGPAGEDDIAALHAALMNSPSHQANILDPGMDYLGVGLATGQMQAGGAMHEMLYLTQNFASTSAPVLVQEEVGGQMVLTTYQDGEPVPGSSEPIEEDPDEDRDDETDEDGDEDDDRDDAPAQGGSGSGGGCFVATAAYGERLHPDVVTLRRLRDEVLRHHSAGRGFIRAYRIVGPHVARLVRPEGGTGRLARRALKPAVAGAARVLGAADRRRVTLAPAWRA